MGKVLQYVESNFGARPDVDKVMKSPDGNSLAVTFTVSPKGKPQMAGLALVAVSATGPGAGAVLSDTPDHLRTSLRPMLTTLQGVAAKAGSAEAQAAIANASGSEAPSASTSVSKSATKTSGAPAASTAATPVKASAPAQKLIQTNFPDGSGSVGLPAGWRMTNAREGDINAQGPKGEKMRFGMAQQAIDFSNPQSRALGRGPGGTAPGNYVAIPFGTPGDVAYKQVLAQARPETAPESALDRLFHSPDYFPNAGQRQNYFLEGNVVDADGPGIIWVEVIKSPMAPMGTWSLNIYEITVPEALAGQEMATVLGMLPTYKTNNAVIMAELNADNRQVQQVTSNALRNARQMTDASDRSTQAMSDYRPLPWSAIAR